MSDSSQETDQKPPHGDTGKAQSYIDKLKRLITLDKVVVTKTDLKRFDPTNLQNHYRIDLGGYHIEISHSKDANTAKDAYVLVFTNVAKLAADSADSNKKVILAYLHLTQDQFLTFKEVADDQLDKIRKAEEEKRFNQAVEPIEQALEHLESQPTYSTPTEENSTEEPSTEEPKSEYSDFPPIHQN